MSDDRVEAVSRVTIRGLEMIYVPGGTFLMGSDEGPDDEKPRHEVHVDGFYIGRFPVTNTQYREYVAAMAHPVPDHWQPGPLWMVGTYPRGKGDHPVVCVSWRDAVGYCRWLSAATARHIRLPTEAEWEKAARGADRRRYPWGDEFAQSKCNSLASKILGTAPVGRYSPQGDSPYGVADMAGNAAEWTNSLFWPYPYSADDGREEVGAGDAWRVVRGGSFDSLRGQVRCSFRAGVISAHRLGSRGFRCAMSPGEQSWLSIAVGP